MSGEEVPGKGKVEGQGETEQQRGQKVRDKERGVAFVPQEVRDAEANEVLAWLKKK